MNELQVKECLRFLNGQFPGQVTEDQGKSLRKIFADLSMTAVKSAIEQHRLQPLEKGFLNIGQLVEGCRAAERGESMEPRQFAGVESYATIIRREWKGKLDKANDYEVFLRHWRAEWHTYSASAVKRQPPTDNAGYPLWQQQFDGAKRRVMSGCRASLISVGMPADVVDSWVETLFAEPSHFQRCLEEIRQMIPPSQSEKTEHETAGMFAGA